jgi:hypothetical protein
VANLWGFTDAPAASGDAARLYRLAAEAEGVRFLDAGSVASVDPAEGVHLTHTSHAALGRAAAARIAERFPLEESVPDTH